MKINATNTIVVLAFISLSACATVSMPDYPRDHPANADAPATPPAATLRTLEDYKSLAMRQERTPAAAPDPEASAPGQAPSQKKDANHDHH